MSRTVRRLGVLAAGLLIAVGCVQDRATAPAAATASHDLLGGTVGTLTSTLGLTSVNGLQRTTPLANDITVVRSIGIQGGTLAIPAAGVTVVIPYGALPQTTSISMTARKGTLVAYDFAPSGITFAVPLTFTQKLAGTNATLLNATSLRLGYYSDPSLLGTTTALVSNIVNGLLNVLDWSFTAPIKHFSGYLVIC
jgi:hypothetical protein